MQCAAYVTCYYMINNLYGVSALFCGKRIGQRYDYKKVEA